MSTPPIQVTIVDAAGVQQTFSVTRVELDCGSGCIEIRPGKPAFCRGFDHCVLTLDDETTVTTLNVTRGMASLTGNVVQVICEGATAERKVWGESPITLPGPVHAPEVENKLQSSSRSHATAPTIGCTPKSISILDLIFARCVTQNAALQAGSPYGATQTSYLMSYQ